MMFDFLLSVLNFSAKPTTYIRTDSKNIFFILIVLFTLLLIAVRSYE